MPENELMFEHLLPIKFKVAVEMRALNEEREPVSIVGPHSLVGDLVERDP